ncbi:MAG: tail fiber domain-containing protein [Planctomycetota bacterium]
MDDKTIRMRYFDRQFLRAKDFEEEQQYHLDRRWRHNRLLHNPGIAKGLQVEQQGDQRVLVKRGTAYDPDGHEIVLVDRAENTVDLSDKEKNPGDTFATPVYLFIRYGERPGEPSTDAPVKGTDTRTLEDPEIKLSRNKPAGSEIILATIKRDPETGNIIEIDPSERPSAGTAVGEDIIVRRIALKKDGVEPGQRPVLTCSGPSQAELQGTLAIGGGNLLLPNTDLGVAGNLYFGGVTDKGQPGLRLFGGLVNNAIPAGFIDVYTTDLKDGLRIRVDTKDERGTERMRITAEGNVGIGTPNPQAALQIKDLTTIAAGWWNGGLWANVGSNSFFDGDWKRIDAGKPGVNLHMSAEGAQGQEFRFRRVEPGGAADNLAVFGSTTSFIRNGNFGIGTDKPMTALHIPERGLQIGTGAPQNNFYWTSDEIDGRRGLRLYGGDYDQPPRDHLITVLRTGNVGIGITDPQVYKLYVKGIAFAEGGWSGPVSDRRFKNNITPLKEALGTILKLRGVSFQWNVEKYRDKGFTDGTHYGLVAQEAEEVVPDLVSEGPDGAKTVNYTEIVPFLIEAVKEQQASIDKQQRSLAALEGDADEMKRGVEVFLDPEVVSTCAVKGPKTTTYGGLMAKIMEVVKALSVENRELKRRIEVLEQRLIIG